MRVLFCYNNLTMEIWKDIPWYKGSYKCSNKWRIKSLKFLKERILKPASWKTWYLTIQLWGKTKTVHRIILSTFKWDSLYECNHIDWNKSNNNIDNLEWCTHSENIIHRKEKLWYKSLFETNHPFVWLKWGDCPNSKKINQYTIDWKYIKTYSCASEASNITWIWRANISAVCSWLRKTTGGFKWKHA